MRQTRSLLLLTSTLLLLPTAVAAEGPVSIVAAPDPVAVVRGAGSQELSLDFMIRNSGPVPLEIAEVRMTAFDGKGALVTRRDLNRLGMCPSVATLPFTTVPPGRTVVAFNPFQSLPARLDLATLKYVFSLVPKGEGEPVEVEVTVRAVPSVVRTRLALPVPGKLLVWDGWDLYAHHRRLDLTHPMMSAFGVKQNITRFGIDFMQVDGTGSTHRGEGRKLEEYYVFGKPVLAPAAGVVADVIADRPDSPIGKMLVDYEALERTKDLRLIGGNFVVIDHANGEFSFLGHLRAGSVKVKKGDRVAAGQQVAEVGSSGDSAEPHLHYQLRRSVEPDSDGLAAEFRGFRLWNGSRAERVERGTVNTGDLVESD